VERRYQLINAATGNLAAGDNETITGNWTFTGVTTVPEATVTAHEAAL
jgi:hypothetical protein